MDNSDKGGGGRKSDKNRHLLWTASDKGGTTHQTKPDNRYQRNSSHC